MISGVGHIKDLLLQQDKDRREKLKSSPANLPDAEFSVLPNSSKDIQLENLQVHDGFENSMPSHVFSRSAAKNKTAVAMESNCESTIPSEEAKVKVHKDKPKHMSDRLWEKYQALHKRREDVSKKSSEKRIRDMQKQCVRTVVEEFKSNPSDLDVLEKHLPDTVSKELKRKKPSSASGQSISSSSDYKQQHWSNIKRYLHVNDHLTGADKSSAKPKSKTEELLDTAIHCGDVETAEKLSDRLATREFGTKIADAIKARNYMEQKKVEDDEHKSKRKKALHWGFAEKQRWETKGNM